MNFLKNIFNSEAQNNDVHRIVLSEEHQLEELVTLSSKEPVIIFKHSTRCGISSMVLNRFDKKITKLAKPYYFLDILKYRQLSNAIQNMFDIRHQSPQLLIIKNGNVVMHDSHYGILEVPLPGLTKAAS